MILWEGLSLSSQLVSSFRAVGDKWIYRQVLLLKLIRDSKEIPHYHQNFQKLIFTLTQSIKSLPLNQPKIPQITR